MQFPGRSWLLITSLFSCFWAAHSFAQGEPVRSLDQDILELFSRDDQTSFDPNGLQVRIEEFKSKALAVLFLEALREKHQVSAIRVEGEVKEQNKVLPFHHAHHIFDFHNPEVFSFEKWSRLRLLFRPDLEAEKRLNLTKIHTFQKLEENRAKLLETIYRTLQNSTAPSVDLSQLLQDFGGESKSSSDFKSLLQEVDQIITTVPGNQIEARLKYVDHLAQSDEGSELSQEIEFFDFYVNLMESLLDPETPLTLGQAYFYFDTLNHSFVKSEMNEDYYFWPKILPVENSIWREYQSTIDLYRTLIDQLIAQQRRDETSHEPDKLLLENLQRSLNQSIRQSKLYYRYYPDRLAVRFYFTPKRVFLREVFEQAIPHQLVKAWKTLAHKAPTDVAWALQSAHRFTRLYSTYLGRTGRRKMNEAIAVLRERSRQLGILPHSFALKEEIFGDEENVRKLPLDSILNGSFDLTLADGRSFDETEIFRVIGLEKDASIITEISFETSEGSYEATWDYEHKQVTFDVATGFLSSLGFGNRIHWSSSTRMNSSDCQREDIWVDLGKKEVSYFLRELGTQATLSGFRAPTTVSGSETIRAIFFDH